MYTEVFNRDLLGPEKPIIIESNEYGIKDRYLAARNFIINTLFGGKVNIDRIIVIKVDETENPNLWNGYDKPIKFNFTIDKFIYGRKLLEGYIVVDENNLVTKYNLGKEESITRPNGYIPINYLGGYAGMPVPTAVNPYYNDNPNSTGYNPKSNLTYKIDIGDNVKSFANNTMTMAGHVSVNEEGTQLKIDDPAIISSVLDDVKKINNPR